jgi:glutamyl-tRNA(Gln) amidotransferase subunit D
LYKGKAKSFLKGISVGDGVNVKKGGKTYDGILMPRNELADENHIVIKLDSGYNIGVKLDKSTKIKLKEKAKPVSQKNDTSFREDPSLPNVTILGTGGTIASKIDYKTGAVAPAFSAKELHSAIPELSTISNIKTKMLFNILSENMTPEHWKTIAREVQNELNGDAHGVIIAHGTDTMGYTGAALGFMIKNLQKPVVLVGSQRSSDRPSSDSAMNLLSAARVAVSDAAGVFVVMHGSLSDDYCLIHKGTRVRKMHSSRRDAFRSINEPPIGRVSDKVEFTEKVSKRGKGKANLNVRFETKVAFVKAHPGMSRGLMDHIVDNYKGIVIEGTGLGHLPEDLLPSFEKARELQIPLVMTTQTIYGRVDMKVYSTGRHLLELGVIPGGDMLPETAWIKLMHALGQTSDMVKIRKIMESNLAGELSKVSRPDAVLW